MKTNEEFQFEHLRHADLHVDAVYRGRRSANAGDDPLNRLLGVSLMGGFRYLGTLDALKLVVLTTSLNDPDWPDVVDRETGTFTVYTATTRNPAKNFTTHRGSGTKSCDESSRWLTAARPSDERCRPF